MSRRNAWSGMNAADITVDQVRAGALQLDDVRIHPDTLIAQADVAAEYGNQQLAENFLRAAELTALPDEQVMAIYEALRPHRSTAQELATIVNALQAAGAQRNAALVAEAAQIYAQRGLLRQD